MLSTGRLIDDFCQNHLSSPPQLPKHEFNTLAQKFQSEFDDRNKKYTFLCELLNALSRKIHEREGSALIYFFDHHHSPLSCHPWGKTNLMNPRAISAETDDNQHPEISSLLSYQAKPDIVATEYPVFQEYAEWKGCQTPAGNYRNFPWHHTRTIVEIRSSSVEDSECQTGTYAGDVHQSRPDLAGAYALYASKEAYSIHWSDCTGAYKSPRVPWTNLDPLLQFVQSLYRPPPAHDAHDDTIELDLTQNGNQCAFVPSDPHWRFPRMLCDFTFRVIFVGPMHSRGTRIFEQQDPPPKQNGPFIVKEVYVPISGRRYDEATLLKDLHSQGGYLPGCLRGIDAEPAPTVRTPEWPTQEARQKHRLLCFDTGLTISHSESVLEFLKAIFDNMESELFLVGYITYMYSVDRKSAVHRAAFNLGVLHRDVSPGNVYIRPRLVNVQACANLEIPQWCREPAPGKPEFINCILQRYHIHFHYAVCLTLAHIAIFLLAPIAIILLHPIAILLLPPITILLLPPITILLLPTIAPVSILSKVIFPVAVALVAIFPVFPVPLIAAIPPCWATSICLRNTPLKAPQTRKN